MGLREFCGGPEISGQGLSHSTLRESIDSGTGEAADFRGRCRRFTGENSNSRDVALHDLADIPDLPGRADVLPSGKHAQRARLHGQEAQTTLRTIEESASLVLRPMQHGVHRVEIDLA